jgi:acetamidase/formamidase
VAAPVDEDRTARLDGVSRDSAEEGLARRGLLRAAAGSLFAAGIARSAAAGEGDALRPLPQGRIHVVESSPETVRVGAMDPKAPAAAIIESGDVVHYPNTWVNWADEAKYGMSFEEREPIRKKYPAGPYSLIGPIEIKGAEPGDVVECRMIRLKPIGWGWNSTPKGVGALPEDFDTAYLRYLRFDDARKRAEFGDGIAIPLAPIQGVIATQPAGDEPVSGILSGAYGGNLVLRELVEGTSVFLPVQVHGARLWTGDSHAAQGDGVVDQTAIETAMEDLRIQYVLHKGLALSAPMAETPTHWITLGFGSGLEDALTSSLRQMIGWLSAASGLAKQDAYSLCSISGSFRITQYAHQINTNYRNIPPKAVHGLMPKEIFDPAMRRRIEAALRPGV